MKQMKQGINKALALFLAVVLAFSPIAAAFGDSMTVYATEASTESETQRSRSAADLHEALETRAETETKAVQNDNKISDDTEKDDGDTTGSGNSSSNGNSSNGGNSDNGGSTRETPAQPTTQEYNYTVNLPGKVGGVDFGTVTLTVKGQDYEVSADNKVTLPAKLETADITAVRNSNYILSGVSVEGTTIKIATATPNVSITMTGAASITVGNTEKYAVTLSDEVWKDAVTWELSDKNAATLDKTTGNEVNVKAKGFAGGDSTATTLTAKVGTVSKSTDITIKKKEVSNLTLAVTPSENGKQGWKTPVNVTVTTDPELAGQTVKITKVKDGSKETKDVTIGQDGTGRIAGWELDKAAAEYSFTASFAGNETYASKTTAEATEYMSTLEKQDPFQLKGDNIDPDKTTEVKDKDGNITQYQYELKESVYPTYGDELEIGTIFGGTEDTWGASDYSFTNNGNNSLKVDADKLYFTAKQAGDFNITVTRTKDNKYNSVSMTFKIKVKKKELHIDNSNSSIKVPEDRVYDGTNVINGITAKFKADDLVVDDQNSYKDTVLTLEGQTEDANAGDGKKVSEIKLVGDLPDHIANNYELTGMKDLETKVNIAKKTLTMEVVIANKKVPAVINKGKTYIERAFDDENKTDGLSVKVTGFVKEEAPANLKDYKNPTVKEDMDKKSTDAPETYVDDYFIPDVLEANATGNYEFDTDNAKGLGLYITASKASIDGGAVQVENSKNVYQAAANKLIYYRYKEKEGEKTEHPVIKWKITGDYATYYSKIFITTGTPNSELRSWTECKNNSYELVDDDILSEKKDVLYIKLATASGGESGEFSLKLKKDNSEPTASVNINPTDTMYEFGNNVTFGHFTNQAYKATMTVSDDNGSGIKKWSYTKLEIKKNKEKYNDQYKTENLKVNSFTEVKESGNQKEILLGNGKESGKFIVFVYVEDNVGNSRLYGSNGLIIDNPDKDTLELKCEGDYKTRDNDPVYYYQSRADFHVTAKDVDSAVSTINAEIVNEDDKKKDDKERNSEEVFNILNEQDIPNRGNKVYATLEQLEKCRTIERDISKELDKGTQCAKYKITVSAKDLADNEIGNETKEFVLDTLKPVVESNIQYKGGSEIKEDHQDQGVYYSNQAVTITTKVTERFTDASLIRLNLIKDGRFYGPSTNTLSEWKKYAENHPGEIEIQVGAEGLLTDNNAKTTISFTIYPVSGEEHNYSYTVGATDYSGNSTGDLNSINFCLDQKKPDVKITYTPTNKDNQQEAALSPGSGIIYLGEDYQNFAVEIMVTEKNFKKGDSILTTYGIQATDSSGKRIDKDKLEARANKLSSYDNGKWTSEPDDTTHRVNHTYDKDANYTFGIFTVTDLAGNKTTVNGAKITLDKVRPTGTLTVANLVSGGTKGEISWNKLVSKLSFGLFGKNSVKVSMSSEDATAGLKSTQYIVTDTLKKRSELEAETKWKDYKKGNVLKLNKNRNYIVYEKVIDKAGNTDYFGTDRVVVDGNSPKPEVTITPSAPGWGKGVYSASDNPGFDILVTDPIENDSYAGLKSVTYTISGGANGYKESNTVTFTAKDHRQSYTGHVNIDPSRFYSNNVQVTVEAVDYSTNGASKQTEEIKIDNQVPKVSFSFDKSDAVGGKYYNKDKTLTITVDERNFDDSYKPEVTSSTNQGWSFSGWSGNGEKHTGTITFTGDADYTVSYFCYDKAGNKSNTEKLDEITIDKTKPTVAVSYDNNNAKNGSYYQEGRTATITITEHNFNASGVTVTTTANLDGGSVAVPQASGWSSSGDTHTATISYPTDGDYTFTISITDMASNVSDPYATDSFTVDLTKPTIEISNIEDHSANKGTVAPVVTLNDTNFDRSNVNIQLTGVHKGVVNTANMYTTADTGKGQVITFANFGKNMDDIYTLKAETTDKAGNAYSTEIVFSVNRDGSTYQYNDYTEELLKKGYTNNPKDIVVSEINVDSLTLSELTLSKNGTVLTLKEGQDYDVQKSGGDVSWKEYVYTIHAANFEDEGDYTISIYSEDKAKNKTTNTSKAKQVEFIVDKTSPVISVANLQEGGHYKTDEQEFTANVDDNMALDKVEYYVDGELKESFDEKAVIEQNGALKLKVGSAAKFQEVSVKAYDKADNEPTIVTMNVLVSASGWVQFYNNKPLFFGTIILILLIVVGGVIIVMRVNRNGSLKMTTNRKEQRK